ncbi:MAG: AAA family ATPase [Anaerolineae bacterium]|nr:AAA family ATPase [Anaerolineae bacterium]
MHIKKVTLLPEKYPTTEHYPFNQPVFHQTKSITFYTPVTLFVGENGTGKSTFLEAIAHKCGIHIWRSAERTRYEVNPYEDELYRYITVEWANGKVPGSFFASDIFRHFTQSLDEWAAADPGMLQYFGGKSLITQSHGQSFMSFFRARYCLKGLYLLDEPETALSPRSQLGLINILIEMSRAGHAQFIVATHSPILLACPDAKIYSFDEIPVKSIAYEETDHYRLYKGFMENRNKYLTGVVSL